MSPSSYRECDHLSPRAPDDIQTLFCPEQCRSNHSTNTRRKLPSKQPSRRNRNHLLFHHQATVGAAPAVSVDTSVWSGFVNGGMQMDDHDDTRMSACNGKYFVDNYRCSEETRNVHDRIFKEFLGRLRAAKPQEAIGD